MFLLNKDLWKIVDGFETRRVTPQLQVDWDKRNDKAKVNILLH